MSNQLPEQVDVQMENAARERRRLTRIQGRHFVGTWTVTAGSPIGPEEDPRYEMLILQTGESTFSLAYRELGTRPWHPLQTLEFMPDTCTLENRTGLDGKPLPGEPERCLTFWNCRVRNRAEKSAIFAMRVGENPQNLGDLPIFETGPNGSWGAEEGGG